MSKYVTLGSKAECPFWTGLGERYILCEGVIDGTDTKTIFKTETDKIDWYVNCCCSAKHSKCPLHKIIMVEHYANG